MDVLGFATELVAVPVEEVLQALEQTRREIRRVAGGITVSADVIEPLGDQGPVTVRRTEQGPPPKPDCRPGKSIEEHAPVAVALARIGTDGVEAQPDRSEE